MTVVRTLALFALPLTLALSSAAPAQAQQVKDPAELTKIFAGNSVNITHRNGALQKAYFDPSGAARTNTSSGSVRDAKWEVKGGTICHDLSNPRKCYTVNKVGDNTYEVQSDDFQWKPTYVVVPGKLEGL
jgi:hypothetical protein